jgi:hypothetical protein
MASEEVETIGQLTERQQSLVDDSFVKPLDSVTEREESIADAQSMTHDSGSSIVQSIQPLAPSSEANAQFEAVFQPSPQSSKAYFLQWLPGSLILIPFKNYRQAPYNKQYDKIQFKILVQQAFCRWIPSQNL